MNDFAITAEAVCTTGQRPLKDLSVLLVDDDTIRRKQVAEALLALGAESIEEASNGDIAHAMLDIARYSVVLTDTFMPGTNGLELLQSIRCGSSGAPRDQPVVVMSSMADVEVFGCAIALDVNGLAENPLSLAEVAAVTTRAVRGGTLLRDEMAYWRVDTRLRSVGRGAGVGTDRHNVEDTPETYACKAIDNASAAELRDGELDLTAANDRASRWRQVGTAP